MLGGLGFSLVTCGRFNSCQEVKVKLYGRKRQASIQREKDMREDHKVRGREE